MKNCEDTSTERYLQGALNPAEEQLLMDHAAICEACFARLDAGTQRAAHMVRSWLEAPAIPRRIDDRVAALGSAPTGPIGRPLVAVAAVLAAVFGILWMQKPVPVQVQNSSGRSTAPFGRLWSAKSSDVVALGTTIQTRGVTGMVLSDKGGVLEIHPIAGVIRVLPAMGKSVRIVGSTGHIDLREPAVVEVAAGGETIVGAVDGSASYAMEGVRRSIPAGLRLRIGVWDLSSVVDDPFALASLDGQTPSILRQLAEKLKVATPSIRSAETFTSEEDALVEKAGTASNAIAGAAALAERERSFVSVQLSIWALHLDPSLRGVSVPTRKALLLAALRDEGDVSVVPRLAGEIPELQPWRRLAERILSLSEYPTIADREGIYKLAKSINARTPAERLALAELCGRLGRALRGKGDALRWEPALLEAARLGYMVADDLAANERQRAMGLHAVSESLHYVGGRQAEGLTALKDAIELWRRPHWLVHYCARLSEVVGPSRLDKNLMAAWTLEGIQGDRSWPSFDRASLALRDCATTEEERGAARDLLVWVADTYKHVSEAQFQCGTRLRDWYRSPESERILERYRKLTVRGRESQ